MRVKRPLLQGGDGSAREQCRQRSEEESGTVHQRRSRNRPHWVPPLGTSDGIVEGVRLLGGTQEHVANTQGVGGTLADLEENAFRQSGGSAGVREEDVILVSLDARLRFSHSKEGLVGHCARNGRGRAASHLHEEIDSDRSVHDTGDPGGERGIEEQHLGARVLQKRQELITSVAVIDIRRNGANLQGSKEDLEILRAVVEVLGDTITETYAKRTQATGQQGGIPFEFRPRANDRAVAKSRRIGYRVGDLLPDGRVVTRWRHEGRPVRISRSGRPVKGSSDWRDGRIVVHDTPPRLIRKHEERP